MALDEIKAELETRKRDLTAELQRLTAPPEAGSTVGFGKRIGDGTTEAVERLATTATARSITASLADIETALSKIAEGTYGLCDSCGKSISPARLEALPATALCRECAH